MKAIKIALLAGLMAMSAPAFAQFANTNSSQSSNDSHSVGLINNTTPYDRMTINFVSRSMDSKKGYGWEDLEGDEGLTTKGVAIDYIHGFSLTKSIPLFLETGVGLDFGFWGDSESVRYDDGESYDFKLRLSTLSFAVPVNLAYRLQFNDAFSLQPYLGLNFKINALANYKIEEEYEDEDGYGDSDDESFNMFDKDDVGDDDFRWNRFQMGWHIGVGMNYNKFYLGLSYGTDFSQLWKKTTTGTFKIGVGVNF